MSDSRLACTVQVASAEYPPLRLAQCDNTAAYTCGVTLVCVFHRNAAVAIHPATASQFEPLDIESEWENRLNRR